MKHKLFGNEHHNQPLDGICWIGCGRYVDSYWCCLFTRCTTRYLNVLYPTFRAQHGPFFRETKYKEKMNVKEWNMIRMMEKHGKLQNMKIFEKNMQKLWKIAKITADAKPTPNIDTVHATCPSLSLSSGDLELIASASLTRRCCLLLSDAIMHVSHTSCPVSRVCRLAPEIVSAVFDDVALPSALCSANRTRSCRDVSPM